MSPTADPGTVSLIPARSHTFMKIDHEIISTVLLHPAADYKRVVVLSYKGKYVQEVLVNHIFKHAQDKSVVG